MGGTGLQKDSSSFVRMAGKLNFSYPPKVAGRLKTKLVLVKPPNYLYKLSNLLSFSHQRKLATAPLRQDSHFSAKFLHVHFATKFDFTNTKKQPRVVSNFAGSNLAQNLTHFDPQK